MVYISNLTFCSTSPQVMALEELEIRDLDHVSWVYAALLCSHIRLLKVMLPRVMWKDVPVVMVFEQNTYVNALADVRNLIEQTLVRSGFRVLFYSKWSQANNKYMLGKHVSAKGKLAMVLSTVLAINTEKLCYCDSVMSLGWAVLSEATNTVRVVESVMGAAKGAGCSNKVGSNMDVSMYRRSRGGANVATDITAMVMERRDVTCLSGEKLTDRMHAEQGKMLLGKLREEMSMVTITHSATGGTVCTGGKRSVKGEYTRDDMLSAFLLLCHTADEICQGDVSVRVHGVLY